MGIGVGSEFAEHRAVVGLATMKPTDDKSVSQRSNAADETEEGNSDLGQSRQTLQPGTRYDRYIVLNEIGYGGMGVVYKAYDPKLERAVALKLISASKAATGTKDQEKERLLREAVALARLSHPNVVAVFDVGKVAEGIFIAMEYIEGQSIKKWLEETRSAWPQILAVFIEAGKGLQAAHDAGIVHRDFKPDNVIVGRDQRVRVLDFGLAFAGDASESAAAQNDPQPAGIESHRQSPETNAQNADNLPRGSISTSKIQRFFGQSRSSAIVGTPKYMAPEQYQLQVLDARTDQYSFAVALYQALYGQLPYDGETIAEYRKSVLLGKLQPPPEGSAPPGWIYENVKRSLSMSPEERFSSMRELLAALAYDPDEEKRKRSARRKILLSLFAGVLLFSGLLAGWELLHPEEQICGGASERTQSIWNASASEKVQKHFDSFGDARARDIWKRVAEVLDTYLQNWQKMYSEACMATHVKRVQSQEILDARMWCLSQRLEEVAALVGAFAAADEKVLSTAILAVHNLTPVNGCEDMRSLSSKEPPRKEIRQEVERISSQLAQVKALHDIGRYSPALDLVTQAIKLLEPIHYLPLQAWSYYWLGRIQDRLGKRSEGEQSYRIALRTAERARDDQLRAQTMSMLIYVDGLFLNKHQEAMQWARRGQAVLERIGGNRLIEAYLRGNEAFVLFQLEKLEQSKKLLQLSYDALVAELGENDPKIAVVLIALGNVSRSLNNTAKSIEYLTRGYEICMKTVGELHMITADICSDLGLAYRHSKEYAKSLQWIRKSIDINSRVLGPDHPATGMAHYYESLTCMDIGQNDKAIEHLMRSLQICEKQQCESRFLPDIHFGLAQCYLKANRQRARSHAEEARLQYIKLAAFPAKVEEVEKWMKDNRMVDAQ